MVRKQCIVTLRGRRPFIVGVKGLSKASGCVSCNISSHPLIPTITSHKKQQLSTALLQNMTNYNHQEELLVNWPHRGADSDDRLSCGGAADKALRRDTLLEHWPKRNSSMTVSSFDFDEGDDDGAAASHNKKRHSVNFSESSQLHVYEREPVYLLRSLAYTKEDRNEFGREAYLEGLRIKNLVAAAPPDSVAESIKYLLRHDIISIEELIGIEHFVHVKPSRVLQTRKQHAAAVLWKQHELQRRKLEEGPVLGLGKFAQSSSLKCTQRARIRAAIDA